MIRLDKPADVGAVLSDLRRARALSQRALAETSRTRQTQISNFELGATRPSLDTLIRLADALGYQLALVPKESAWPAP